MVEFWAQVRPARRPWRRQAQRRRQKSRVPSVYRLRLAGCTFLLSSTCLSLITKMLIWFSHRSCSNSPTLSSSTSICSVWFSTISIPASSEHSSATVTRRGKTRRCKSFVRKFWHENIFPGDPADAEPVVFHQLEAEEPFPQPHVLQTTRLQGGSLSHCLHQVGVLCQVTSFQRLHFQVHEVLEELLL